MLGTDQVCSSCASEGRVKGCICRGTIQLIGNNCLPHHINKLEVEHNLVDLDLALRMQRDPSLIPTHLNKITGQVSRLNTLQEMDTIIKESSIALSENTHNLSELSKLILKYEQEMKQLKPQLNPKPLQPYSLKQYSNTHSFTGHTSNIYSVYTSGDGSRIISGSGYPDNTVRIWNTINRTQEAVLTGHSREVLSVCMSGDRRLIVSGSGDTTVRIWNAIHKIQEAVLIGHTRSVYSVCMSEDDRLIVSGSGDKTVRIWNMLLNSQEAVLTGHTDSVISVCISGDGSRIVSGSGDKTVRVWNLIKKTQIAVLSGHTDTVLSVSMSWDGRWIASGSYDTTVRIWDAMNKTQEAV